MIRKRGILLAGMWAGACLAAHGAEDWKYTRTLQVPVKVPVVFVAATPSGDVVATTFNNSRTTATLPLVLIHNPLSDNPSFHLVAQEEFPPVRGYSGVVCDKEGNIFATGDTGDFKTSWLKKYRPNGSPDSQFGAGGRIRPQQCMLGMDIAGDKLIIAFGFGKFGIFDRKTGKEGSMSPPSGLEPSPAIRDISFDASRQLVFGVAQGGAWVWEGGTLANPKGYKLRRLSNEANAVARSGEGCYYDAVSQRLLMPVQNAQSLQAVDTAGAISSSGFSGLDKPVVQLADAVLLNDGATIFISDMGSIESGGTIYVMRRSSGGEDARMPELQPSSGETAALPGPATPPGGTPELRTGQVQWLPSVQAALEQGRRENRPVLMYARDPAVQGCISLEQGLLSSPAFGAVAAKFICATVDMSRDRKEAQQLGVFKLPYVAVYAPGGERRADFFSRNMGEEILPKIEAAGR